MYIQSDKIKKGGLCYAKEGPLRNINYPLRIWEYIDGFNPDTGKGRTILPVRNFGGETSGDLMRGQVPKGERNFFCIVDNTHQTLHSRELEFSFLCYIDEFVERIVDELECDAGECFTIIHNITSNFNTALRYSIKLTKRNIKNKIFLNANS